jgi:zinc protease
MRKVANMHISIARLFRAGFVALLCVMFLAAGAIAQEQPPAPSAPKSGIIPAVRESKLKNGLTIAVVEKHSVPLVTVQLLVRSGASSEPTEKAGLANLTASMLTKGTKTRSATQIAEEMEFLGGSINSGAGWNNSNVSITVTPDKLDKAMNILADVVLNPAFKTDELELLRSQTLDGLTFSLKQPGFLGTFVASKYAFGEHPAGGTPTSIAAIGTADVAAFHRAHFVPGNAVLIYTGDISNTAAVAASNKFFGKWAGKAPGSSDAGSPSSTAGNRLLVVDLPNSGQAAVSYRKAVGSVGRRDRLYYPSSVLNSLIGGGYSSRLNQEIRIKRGLSYGAGSNFGWRSTRTNFTATAQTKNESAAEVTQLVLAEVKRLAEGTIPEAELTPRKSVLTGGFGRNLETTVGLSAAVADLFSFGIPTTELSKYIQNVNLVTDAEIRSFASRNLMGGDIIIVGDYSVFKDDLAKRFPNAKIEVIKAADLDLSQDDLQK